MKRRIAVLASGGLDSNILLSHFLKRCDQVYPIYIRCGLFWEEAELHWLKKYLRVLQDKRLKPLILLNLPVSEILKNWALTGRGVPSNPTFPRRIMIPGRNLLLLSKAALFCSQQKIPRLAIGSHAVENPFPDASRKFFDLFSRTASKGLGFPLRIDAPFLKIRKHQILKMADENHFKYSFSCFRPRGFQPCGKCYKCRQRKAANVFLDSYV